MSQVMLTVSAPACSFRKPYAREFLESERVPPPSTVYGFLLSLVGEEDRHAYIGAELAIAIIQRPAVSLILRTAWRIKKKKLAPGSGANRRPDYQEVLTGLKIAVAVGDGPLSDRLERGMRDPGAIERFGGLCLGESRDLVDEVRLSREWEDARGLWLVQDERGDHPLPIWVDHVGSKGTRWGQFRLEDASLADPPSASWIKIEPPIAKGRA